MILFEKKNLCENLHQGRSQAFFPFKPRRSMKIIMTMIDDDDDDHYYFLLLVYKAQILHIKTKSTACTLHMNFR